MSKLLYIILTDHTHTKLSQKVTEKINEGYEPYGNPYAMGSSNHIYCQAMIHQKGINKCIRQREQIDKDKVIRTIPPK